MNFPDLKSIVNNMNAKGNLPIVVRVNFGDKGYTVPNVESFNQFSDVIQLNATIEFPEVEKLMELRRWLDSETERWQEKSKEKTNSKEGEHYDRGHAAGLIAARAKLEELFNYWEENR